MGGYLPGTERERRDMLAALGLSSADELFAALPEGVRLKGLSLPEGLSQQGVERRVRALAAENTVYPTILRGAGAERHFIPAIVNEVASREVFVTAYTPYQPEISQGVLQSIFEYQSMVCDLYDMDVANASVYDGASAAARGRVHVPRTRACTRAGVRRDEPALRRDRENLRGGPARGRNSACGRANGRAGAEEHAGRGRRVRADSAAELLWTD